MKQMDLSSLHRAPRSQHGLQIFTFASQKRREKKKNKSSKSDTNWYDVEGQSVGVLFFIFSSSIKVSIISSRLVQLHILLQFHFLNMGSAFYKKCFYVWKEKSFPPSSWWFHFLYSRRQCSLLTQHSKKKTTHSLKTHWDQCHLEDICILVPKSTKGNVNESNVVTYDMVKVFFAAF